LKRRKGKGGSKMIVERLVKAPDLWDFVKEKMPTSLKPLKLVSGYGFTFHAVPKDANLWGWMNCKNIDIVATIDYNLITVNHPEYFSDFEKLGLEYERKYGKEVKLRFWETV
jgi:hypothetical protein